MKWTDPTVASANDVQVEYLEQDDGRYTVTFKYPKPPGTTGIGGSLREKNGILIQANPDIEKKDVPAFVHMVTQSLTTPWDAPQKKEETASLALVFSALVGILLGILFALYVLAVLAG